MKSHLLLCFLLIVLSASAQKIRITELNRDYFRQTNVEGFEYLHQDMAPDLYEWIADVEIEFDTLHPNTIKEFYSKMNEKANKLGANAYRIKSSNLTSFGGTKTIVLRFYFLHYEYRKENKERFQDNVIYLFGFLGHHQNMEGYKIQINGEKLIIPEQSYFEMHPSVGTSVTIQLSRGFKRNEIVTVIDAKMLPRYYRPNVYRGIFSRSVIDEYDWNFGEFLVHILKKHPLILP